MLEILKGKRGGYLGCVWGGVKWRERFGVGVGREP